MRSLLFVAVAGAACTTSPPPYSPDDYFRELGATHCHRMDECCTTAEYQDWWTADSTGSVGSCAYAHQHPPFRPAIENALAKGTIVFDIAAARDCVATLEQMACSQFEPAIRFRETYCISPFIGTIADGGRCSIDAECIGTSCHITDPTHQLGVCQSRLPDGAACDLGSSTEECAAGDYCQYPTQTCSRGLPPGSECTSDSQCADDWCKGDGFLVPGHCVRACDG